MLIRQMDPKSINEILKNVEDNPFCKWIIMFNSYSVKAFKFNILSVNKKTIFKRGNPIFPSSQIIATRFLSDKRNQK